MSKEIVIWMDEDKTCFCRWGRGLNCGSRTMGCRRAMVVPYRKPRAKRKEG